MPLPSNLSYLGIAKETTKGTGVAATAFIPFKTFDPVDHVMYIEDTGMRGAMGDLFDEIAGPTYSEISIGGHAYADTFPWWAVNIMGDLTVTGGAAPYSHAAALKNTGDGQPGAVSITDFYGITGTNSRRYAGCQVSELGLKFNAEGGLEYTSKVVGFPSALVAKPSQSFGAIPPYPNWVATLTIAGAQKLFMTDGELNVKRSAAPIHTHDGTQAPYAIWVGGIRVDGKFTFVHEDDTELTRYLTATKPALVLDWTTGASSALTEIKATMSKVQYTVGAVKRGKDYIETDISYAAIMNTTDVGSTGGYGPLKWTLQNALASGTFA